MFTQEQINEISTRLRQQGIKDSELPVATLPLTGEEYIPILQNGENKKVTANSLNIGGSEGTDTGKLKIYGIHTEWVEGSVVWKMDDSSITLSSLRDFYSEKYLIVFKTTDEIDGWNITLIYEEILNTSFLIGIDSIVSNDLFVLHLKEENGSIKIQNVVYHDAVHNGFSLEIEGIAERTKVSSTLIGENNDLEVVGKVEVNENGVKISTSNGGEFTHNGDKVLTGNDIHFISSSELDTTVEAGVYIVDECNILYLQVQRKTIGSRVTFVYTQVFFNDTLVKTRSVSSVSMNVSFEGVEWESKHLGSEISRLILPDGSMLENNDGDVVIPIPSKLSELENDEDDPYTRESDLADVAKSGDYNDLSNIPSITKGITIIDNDDNINREMTTLNSEGNVKPVATLSDSFKLVMDAATTTNLGGVQLSGSPVQTTELSDVGMINTYGTSKQIYVKPATEEQGGAMGRVDKKLVNLLKKVTCYDDVILRFNVSSFNGSTFNYTGDPIVFNPSNLSVQDILGKIVTEGIAVRAIIDFRALGITTELPASAPHIWEGYVLYTGVEHHIYRPYTGNLTQGLQSVRIEYDSTNQSFTLLPA